MHMHSLYVRSSNTPIPVRTTRAIKSRHRCYLPPNTRVQWARSIHVLSYVQTELIHSYLYVLDIILAYSRTLTLLITHAQDAKLLQVRLSEPIRYQSAANRPC